MSLICSIWLRNVTDSLLNDNDLIETTISWTGQSAEISAVVTYFAYASIWDTFYEFTPNPQPYMPSFLYNNVTFLYSAIFSDPFNFSRANYKFTSDGVVQIVSINIIIDHWYLSGSRPFYSRFVFSFFISECYVWHIAH